MADAIKKYNWFMVIFFFLILQTDGTMQRLLATKHTWLAIL
jgi:hypothetical protein